MRVPDPEAGTVDRGWLEVTSLPTGGAERLPVVVVAGGEPGPTCWVTGGVHGDEATGVAAVQDVASAFDDGDARLAGTVDPSAVAGRLVCVPVTSPAGLRRTSRYSYYHGEDPNRSFPDPTGSSETADTVQELVAERLYEAFSDAAFLLDLHTAQVNSVPFAIRHRVLYGERRDREAAASLADDLERLVESLGLPVVTQYPAAEYVDRGLHRSAVGGALNGASVPACTVELGGHSTVDDDKRAAGVAAVFRALAAFDVLPSVPASVARADSNFASPVDYRTCRYRGPRTDVAGVVRHRVAAGETVEAGDVVADVCEANGAHLATVETPRDGYVLGHTTGLAVYENDPVASMAVRDEDPLVAERP